METHVVKVDNPKELNLIFGMTHFIKSVEDIYEIMVGAVPNIKFGMAFCEASQDRLIRTTGTDDGLVKLAADNMLKIKCGHTFLIFLGNAFPINVLNQIKACPEVCGIFCATANPIEVIVAETDLGRGVLGVIDGLTPLGVENDEHKQTRKEFLRMIGYKK